MFIPCHVRTPLFYNVKFCLISGEDSFFYRNEDGAVILFNCSTNSSSLFMDNTTFVSSFFRSFEVCVMFEQAFPISATL